MNSRRGTASLRDAGTATPRVTPAFAGMTTNG